MFLVNKGSKAQVTPNNDLGLRTLSLKVNLEHWNCILFYKTSALCLIFLHRVRPVLTGQDEPTWVCIWRSRGRSWPGCRRAGSAQGIKSTLAHFSYGINHCGISSFYILLVIAFYLTDPFLLFLCVGCHLLFEKLYLRNLECRVILCTSSVYVWAAVKRSDCLKTL